MTLTYENLSGGLGRTVFFRHKRYRAQSLMREVMASVQLGDAPAILKDLSVTGLAVRVADASDQPAVGAVVSLSMRLRNQVAFSGQVQVVRAERDARWTTLGVRLVNGLLDPAALRVLHDRVVVEDAVAGGSSRFADIPRDYRELCGDAAFFFTYWRATLDQVDRNRASDRFSGDLAVELEMAAEGRMRREWDDIRSRGNEITRAMNPDEPLFSAAKQFTEIQLTPLTLSAPIWKRAYEKPLGYPGDFVLMNYMYEPTRCGTSAFARVLHELGREERLAATVPSRKDLLVKVIRSVVDEKHQRGAQAAYLASVGAGPARELEEYLSTGAPRLPLTVSLIDQDEDALAFANERLRRASLPYGNRVTIQCRYISFRQLLERPDVLAELNGQDMIYSAGLVDYLSERVATGLVHLSYDLVAPNGLLAFGNAGAAPDVRWVPEFLLDWHMIYRTEDELLRISSTLPKEAAVKVERDSSDAWCFLSAKKPSI